MTINKLRKLLQKRRIKEIEYNRNDPYADRMYLGYLDISLSNGEVIGIDLRNFTFNRKQYKLEVFGVNYTHFGGYVNIKVNPENIKLMTYRSTN